MVRTINRKIKATQKWFLKDNRGWYHTAHSQSKTIQRMRITKGLVNFLSGERFKKPGLTSLSRG